MIIQIDIEQNQLEKFQNIADNLNISLSELLINSAQRHIESSINLEDRLSMVEYMDEEEEKEILKLLNSMNEEDKKISYSEIVRL